MNGNSPKIFCLLFIIWSNLNSCVSDLSSQQSYALVAILWRRKKITRRWGVPESNLGLISPKAGNQATELYWHSTVNHQDSKKKKIGTSKVISGTFSSGATTCYGHVSQPLARFALLCKNLQRTDYSLFQLLSLNNIRSVPDRNRIVSNRTCFVGHKPVIGLTDAIHISA